MSFEMHSNGTIRDWKNSEGKNILFPQTELVSGHGVKERGGAHVCSPIFGTVPTDGPYKGVTLPQHGLVRDSIIIDGKPAAGNRAHNQSGPDLVNGDWTVTRFGYMYPYPHRVWVAAKEVTPSSKGSQHLKHRLGISTGDVFDLDMPYSLGFHPYFATHGENFELRHGEQNWNKEDIHVDKPFFVPHQPGTPFALMLEDAIIHVHITAGYNGFYVWTDRPDLYVCIEPVCVGTNTRYQMLQPGGSMACECSIRYAPIG